MSLLQKTAEKVRNTFHPLHHLRKSRIYQHVLRPVFDLPIPANLGLRNKVHLRLLTHLSFLFLSRKMEAKALNTFSTILEYLDVGQESFIDVGANIGLYTWHALERHLNLHVATFEPDPRNAKLLRQSAKQWKAPNLLIYSLAASNKTGQATFTQDLLSSATGSLDQSETSFAERHYSQQPRNIEVSTTTLDIATRDMPPPLLVKIDVEGHESEVLEGAEQMLEVHRPILMIESFGVRAQAIWARLVPLGYKFLDADTGQNTRSETMNHLCVNPQKTKPILLSRLAEKGLSFKT